ncbi:helix-turn-helix domain-containing protein [Paraconexibacter antarcticus]|uniref:Helix-turn-helix domain-containing protein n=1 Tax=Paraconexibacter antarcticus TaxID=2949664 RepID=A0ABY5DKN7_9ACTN|nr:helix-turn-helix domain-containing protein [Paraconexibacter antarcticus]UTI62286.1 helix-turn-helix domain-containing protein [Paraconexibacter antarcticus]
MFDMRKLEPSRLTSLTSVEAEALRLVVDGASPRDIAERLRIPEDALYRLVTWALDEVEPAPGGRTIDDVHSERGSRPATAAELLDFEAAYGASLPPDHEG